MFSDSMDYSTSPASSSSSSSSSTRSSPVHSASLVDPAAHSPALMELIDIKISRPFIGMSLFLLSLSFHY